MTSSIFLASFPKLELAKAINGAKGKAPVPLTQEQKDRKKRLDRERAEKRREENLAQRALVESRRV